MADLTIVEVPDIGDFEGVEVIEVLVSVGDEVEAEASLITLESDKSSMEIPAEAPGRIEEILVKVGDKVAQGTPIVKMTVSAKAPAAETKEEVKPKPKAEPAPALPPPAAKATPPPPKPAPPPPAASSGSKARVHASPAIRRFARELGVDLGQVRGTGRKGRITKADVQGFVQRSLAKGSEAGSGIPPIPEVDFSKWGEIELQPLTKINKLTAQNLHRSWLNVPLVTQYEDADITDLEAFRKANKALAERDGVKLTFVTFILKAVAAALKTYPKFGASLDPTGENLIIKKYVHVGVAVDTPKGLVVPVLRDVDKKGIFALAAELQELSDKARKGRLMPGEMQGGVFTISSLGGIGGTKFTPLVNAPEVAILGVSRAQMQPVWDGSAFSPRLMLPLCLSYDHRVIDGADAARFIVHLSSLLSDLRRALL